MTAPGDNLEFKVLPDFSCRTKPVEGLEEHVVDLLRKQPTIGQEIAPAVRRADLQYGRRNYRVFYGRRRNSIGLVAIYDLDVEDDEARAMEEDLKLRHKKTS